MISPNQNCTFVYKNYCWALKRPHSSVQKIIVELGTLDTSQTHDLWLDSKYSPELKLFGLTWLTGTGSLVSKTFSLLTRFAILASTVIIQLNGDLLLKRWSLSSSRFH